jgi:hypothetical protein
MFVPVLSACVNQVSGIIMVKKEMNIMKRHLRTWILSLSTIFMILVGWAMPTLPQLPDDIPDFVKKVLEEEGVDLEELKNNPELRREMQKKVMENPELRAKFQEMSDEKSKGEETPQGKSEDKQRGPKGGKRQGKGGKGGGGVNEYYKSIVDNNLFKPLGWKGDEKGGPAFRLVGTVIARGRAPKALIFEFAKNTTHYVAMGDKIGNATVKSIDEKSVTIDQNGEELKLNIMQESPFLGGSSGGGGGGGGGRPQATGSTPPTPRKGGGRSGGKGPGVKKIGGGGTENMSPEEREKLKQKMMEAQKMGGGEGGGGDSNRSPDTGLRRR